MQFFTIVDDDINEDEQSFAIVAEIEIEDVPENISCFQTTSDGGDCFGLKGAFEIQIGDNDGELPRCMVFIK